ncbi:MAG: ABC transporter substrate-binding protein/permease, partial [Clostridia bacterium]|nr:ABC transporter substrate-binding protein/permease [Clostridia bacterium]
MKHTKHLLVMMFALLLVILTALPCFAVVNVSELDGKKAGVMIGTPQDDIVNGAVNDAEIMYFNNFADLALALKENKIDFFVNSSVSFMLMEQEYPEFTTTVDSLKSFDLGVIFPMNDKGRKLQAEVSDYIAEIKENGKLKELEEYWISTDEKKGLNVPTEGENGILHMATSSTTVPFSYIVDGKPAGFDMAIICGFCEEYGYGLKIDDMDLGGVITSIGSGKYDLAASQISWTAERAESVLYSDTYYTQYIVGIVKRESGENAVKPGFFTRVKDNFIKTFIKEARWKLILEGMLRTVSLTVLSAILGSILGYYICIMRRNSNRLLSFTADIYIKLFQGMPIVVLLLIMYYIVFAGAPINAFWVAVAAFSLNFAAYASEIMRSGIDSIDKGQREAALALGYNEKQAFRNFVLPQAAVRFMPVLK